MKFKSLILGTLLFASPLFAQVNPFLTPSGDNENSTTTTISESSGEVQQGFGKTLLALSASLQNKINTALTRISRTLEEDPKFGSYLLIFLLSLSYGIVHALGPGHGKIFALSYFIGEDAEVTKGILLGTFVAFLHALSAILLVTILKFVLESAVLVKSQQVETGLRQISYGIITTLGLYLILSHLLQKNHAEDGLGEKQKKRSALALALSIGLIPCTGSIIVLLFFLSIGHYGLGLLAVLFMAIGMAMTITSVGVLTIFARKKAVSSVKNSETLSKFQLGLEIFGASLIFLFGLSFFISSF